MFSLSLCSCTAWCTPMLGEIPIFHVINIIPSIIFCFHTTGLVWNLLIFSGNSKGWMKRNVFGTSEYVNRLAIKPQLRRFQQMVIWGLLGLMISFNQQEGIIIFTEGRTSHAPLICPIDGFLGVHPEGREITKLSCCQSS